jgi:hypothetical protein
MRKLFLAAAAASMTVPVIPSPAMARGYSRQDLAGFERPLSLQASNGTTGLIVGAAGGALVGRAIDTRGERATGTILVPPPVPSRPEHRPQPGPLPLAGAVGRRSFPPGHPPGAGRRCCVDTVIH